MLQCFKEKESALIFEQVSPARVTVRLQRALPAQNLAHEKDTYRVGEDTGSPLPPPLTAGTTYITLSHGTAIWFYRKDS